MDGRHEPHREADMTITTNKWSEFVWEAWKAFPTKRPLTIQEQIHVAVGDITGEAGEVADKIKKWLRDEGMEWDKLDRKRVLLELGDVLFGVTALAHLLGADLQVLMRAEMDKIKGRKKRGTLNGSGDDR
jgi:NTP pyrophosphatase (non-canonical NTP hydrolase)